MLLRSTPFSPAQFNDWRQHAIAAYAADKIAAATWTAADATRLSTESYDKLLPAGAETVGHALRRIVDDDSGELVGWIWVGPPGHDSAPGTGWLYDIEIMPARRGQGLGRTVVKLAEDEARSLGFSTLGLHVFAHNPVARHLYEACDFELTDLSYTKPL